MSHVTSEYKIKQAITQIFETGLMDDVEIMLELAMLAYDMGVLDEMERQALEEKE